MLYDYWNALLLVAPIALLCFTSGPQPRFHAAVMLCTGCLGIYLPKFGTPERFIGFLVYTVLNFITLALSPLQLILVWYLNPKPEIDHGIVVHHNGDKYGNISVE